MGIDKNNYEAYLLDLWEGNLSEEDKVMLSQFLEKHPELNDEDALNLLEDISITDNNTNFDKASINFEQINLVNYEFFFVAFLEGDLSNEEMIAVNKFLGEHPTLNKEFTQFKNTKLPIEKIEYPHKEKLIFGKAPIFSMGARRRLIVAVAASIAFIIWTSSPFQKADYQYTLTPTGKKNIDKGTLDTLLNDTQKRETNPIVDEVETRFAVEDRFSPSNKEKKALPDKINEKNFNKSIPSEKENQNFIAFQEGSEKKEKNNNNVPSSVGSNVLISNALASNVTSEQNEKQTVANNSPYVKEEIPTLIDLTASYLQRKNILDNERKADIKGIMNSALAKLNKNKQPVFDSSEESNMKTIFFQFGSLKVERKTTK